MNKKGLTCVLAGFLLMALSGFKLAYAGDQTDGNFYNQHRSDHTGNGKLDSSAIANWKQMKKDAQLPEHQGKQSNLPADTGSNEEWRKYNMMGDNYPGANYKTHHQDNLNNRGRGHSQRGNSGACGSEYTHMSGSFRDKSNAQRRKNLLGGSGVNACIESTGNLHRVLITTDYIRNDPQRGVGVSKRP